MLVLMEHQCGFWLNSSCEREVFSVLTLYLFLRTLGRMHLPYSRVVTPPSLLRPPPPPLFSAKLLLRVTFCSLIRPPPLTHAHMCLACSYLNVYSSTTLLSLLNVFACSLEEGCVRVVQDYDSDTAA